jgi:hypothetical protein
LASFSVKGPFNVPVAKFKVGRGIDKTGIATFWEAHSELATQYGCYVFGFRAAKGSKPVYVGKATRTFKQEVFTDHKLNKYSQAFAVQAKGVPILFFVCLNRAKGARNKTAIDEVESFLIQAGLAANKNLLNDRKISVESWSIGGILRSRGKAPAPAQAFRKFIKLRHSGL